MMHLTKRKSKLRFETSSLYRGHTLIVECAPEYCTLRAKGTRESYVLPWDAAFSTAAKLAAAALNGKGK